MKNLLFGSCSPSGSCAQFCYAIFRIWVGVSMLIFHGWGKLTDPSGIIGTVSKTAIPAPEITAWGAILAESVGAALIAIGLLTRPAAIIVAITMGTAAFYYHQVQGDPWKARELALLYLAASIVICAFGSGKFGIDSAIKGKGGSGAA